MEQLLYEIARILVVIIAALVTCYFIPWLKAKTKSLVDEKLYNIVETAVQAAEQNPIITSGEDKKEYAKDFIKAICEKSKIKATDEEIDGLIEAAVFGMNLMTK